MRMERDIIARLATMLAAFAIIVVFTVFDAWPSMYKRMENILYDWRANLYTEQQVDRRVVIIDIDEASLAAEGRWPWPRDKLAQLLYNLNNHYGVSQIGLDLIFPELTHDTADRALVQAIMDSNAVASVAFALTLDNNQLQQGKLGRSVDVVGAQLPHDLALAAQGYVGNNSLFAMDYSMGHITPIYDIDGTVRQFAPLIQYDGQYYDTLAVAMVRRLFELDGLTARHTSQVWANGGLMSSSRLTLAGLVDVPIDQHGLTWLPLQRSAGSYRYISATDILNQRVPADTLLGTLALVGTSASGLHDLVSTPLVTKMPGVEVHAHILSALLDANFLITNDYFVYITLLLILVMGGLLVMGSYWSISYFNLLLALALLCFWLLINNLAWAHYKVPLPILAPALFIPLTYLLLMAFNYNQSKGERSRLLSFLRKYVPAPVVKAAMAKKQALVDPKERVATILFMDIRGFTTLSEQYPAQHVNDYVAGIMETVSELVESNGGIIDKYIGDAVMAFWDSDQWPDHADRAVKSALQIESYFDHNELPDSCPQLPVKFGIGINTGMVMIGQMGTKSRATYTVMGDVVNVASRLQGISQTYDVTVVMGSGTATLLEHMPYQSLGQVNLRGRDKPETIHTPAVSIA